ncbi:MAG: type IV pili methyl-accepting chemotaxis transducer N-terminal domain-containing protein, partial [Gammaproteobacteria bacterium]|nr:type IV pili methyl-accepting chemotaxis transducer N-terminal domain-containing protein [Gammaproteobacteria bacterium]
MKSIFKNSLLLRLGLAMTLITSLGFISMVSSVFIAEETQGAAGAINSAGSLRMLSYKIATKLGSRMPSQQSSDSVNQLVEKFDQRINALGQLNITNKPVLKQAQAEILKRWNITIRPTINAALNSSVTINEQPSYIRYADIVEQFVSQIDHFVKLLEDSLESDIQLL